jgi:hypothetical protein
MQPPNLSLASQLNSFTAVISGTPAIGIAPLATLLTKASNGILSPWAVMGTTIPAITEWTWIPFPSITKGNSTVLKRYATTSTILALVRECPSLLSTTSVHVMTPALQSQFVFFSREKFVRGVHSVATAIPAKSLLFRSLEK